MNDIERTLEWVSIFNTLQRQKELHEAKTKTFFFVRPDWTANEVDQIIWKVN